MQNGLTQIILIDNHTLAQVQNIEEYSLELQLIKSR